MSVPNENTIPMQRKRSFTIPRIQDPRQNVAKALAREIPQQSDLGEGLSDQELARRRIIRGAVIHNLSRIIEIRPGIYQVCASHSLGNVDS